MTQFLFEVLHRHYDIMDSVNTLDAIIIFVFCAGALIGFFKGFIRQLASLLGLVVGLIAAKTLYTSLAEELCPTVTDSMTVAQVLAFIVIWIAVPLIFSIVGSLLTRLMEVISLKWFNHLLGAALGGLKFLLATSLVIAAIEFFYGESETMGETKKSESALYYPMRDFACGIFFPAAKDLILSNENQ